MDHFCVNFSKLVTHLKIVKYSEFNVIRTFPWVFMNILKKIALFGALLQNFTSGPLQNRQVLFCKVFLVSTEKKASYHKLKNDYPLIFSSFLCSWCVTNLLHVFVESESLYKKVGINWFAGRLLHQGENDLKTLADTVDGLQLEDWYFIVLLLFLAFFQWQNLLEWRLENVLAEYNIIVPDLINCVVL